jgi:hypothetical protein
MFMKDNLVLQIQAYDDIYDYHHKMLFIEKLLHYYEHTPYTSNEKEICSTYWNKTLEELYSVVFTYF